MRSQGFQSTLPRGERPTLQIGEGIFLWFQSTLPRGERQNITVGDCREYGFNPRSRVGSDRHPSAEIPTGTMFQSTLPRGERHRENIIENWELNVSIHAPAWGATYNQRWALIREVVSIHAPAWGATGGAWCPIWL